MTDTPKKKLGLKPGAPTARGERAPVRGINAQKKRPTLAEAQAQRDSRPPRREGGGGFGDRPPRREGGGGFGDRPPRREGGGGFGDRPPRREGGGGFGDRPPRREGGGGFGDRPPRREGGGGFGDRPPHREGGGGFGDRPPRREGGGGFGDRPPRREGGGSFGDRPPRREGGGGFGDRPPRREGGGGFGDRPPRREGGGGFGDRPPRREGGGGFGDRPPRREGGGGFGDRPPRREGGGGFGDRPPRREGGGGFGDRPPRRDGGGGFGDRPPRREGGGGFGDRPPRRDAGGGFGDRPPRRDGGGGFGDRPPRRDPGAYGERPPRSDEQQARPPRVAPQRLNPEEGERLSKRMAELGLASRREADEWILAGWVKVDGVVAQLGLRVGAQVQIDIDPAARQQQAQRVTILLHKPVGYVSGQPEDGYEPAVVLLTEANRWVEDPLAPKLRFTPAHLRGLAPAGRLDIDSTGLLVLTQDGRVAKALIGEDSDIEKEYLVRVAQDGAAEGDSPMHSFPPEKLALLNHGLALDGVQLREAKVSWANEDQLRFVLREGRKRQIRRMCEAVGLSVLGLKRVRIGRIPLSHLPAGQWRYLAPWEKF